MVLIINTYFAKYETNIQFHPRLRLDALDC